DLAGPSGVVRLHGLQVLERAFRTVLDQLARAHCRNVARTEASQPHLHLDGGEPLAEQLAALAAHRAVAGDEQHWAAPVTAQRRVDAGLANEPAVEREVLPRLARHRV